MFRTRSIAERAIGHLEAYVQSGNLECLNRLKRTVRETRDLAKKYRGLVGEYLSREIYEHVQSLSYNQKHRRRAEALISPMELLYRISGKGLSYLAAASEIVQMIRGGEKSLEMKKELGDVRRFESSLRQVDHKA